MCLCVFIFAACSGTIFYLYVLQAYQTHLTYNPARIGSHKDIFPTLYALSLSNTAHKSLGGRNILAKMAKNFTYSRDTSFALHDKKTLWSFIMSFLPMLSRGESKTPILHTTAHKHLA